MSMSTESAVREAFEENDLELVKYPADSPHYGKFYIIDGDDVIDDRPETLRSALELLEMTLRTADWTPCKKSRCEEVAKLRRKLGFPSPWWEERERELRARRGE
jgi:hypothetical protein